MAATFQRSSDMTMATDALILLGRRSREQGRKVPLLSINLEIRSAGKFIAKLGKQAWIAATMCGSSLRDKHPCSSGYAISQDGLSLGH